MIRTIDDASITLPAISSSTLTIRRKMIQSTPTEVIHAAICCGMFSFAIRNENSTALVMM